MTSVQIRQFITVAKFLSFSKAAAALYVSQPALSKQIQKMEDELGFALFERSTHDVCLTAAGDTMFRFFDSMASAYDLTYKKALQQDSGNPRAITIGVQDNSSYGPIIASLSNAARDAAQSLTIEFNMHQRLMEYLHTGYIDLALTRYEPDDMESEFSCVELELNEDLIFVSAASELAACRQLEPALFSGRMLCVPGLHEEPQKDCVCRMMRVLGMTPGELRVVPNLETALFMVSSRDAFLFGDEHLTIARPDEYRSVHTGLYHSTALIWNRGNPNPAVAKLANAVKSATEYRKL